MAKYVDPKLVTVTGAPYHVTGISERSAERLHITAELKRLSGECGGDPIAAVHTDR